jgi:hypothetical protein
MTDDTKQFALKERWGEAIEVGFVAIPNLLIEHQAKLGLSDTELVVLINIGSYWWSAERLPFPRTRTIAERMGGVHRKRTVERALESLRNKGLIWKVPRASVRTFLPEGHKEQDRGKWDLSGLVKRLTQFVEKDRRYLAKTGQPVTARGGDDARAVVATG